MSEQIVIASMMPNSMKLDLDGKSIEIKGLNSLLRKEEDGTYASPLIIQQYAYSHVPADFWERWSKIYRDHPIVRNHLIFAEKTLKNAKAKAKEMQKDIKSGFEGVNPDKVSDPKILSGK